MIPDAPLSDEELDELEQFLISDTTPEECMDIAMLDGFLTALVIGPNTLLPSQWLPAVWGETDEEEMVWESGEQMQRILGLVMRMYNDRVHDLHEDSTPTTRSSTRASTRARPCPSWTNGAAASSTPSNSTPWAGSR